MLFKACPCQLQVLLTHHSPRPLARIGEALWKICVVEDGGVPLAAGDALPKVLGGDHVGSVTQTVHPGEL